MVKLNGIHNNLYDTLKDMMEYMGDDFEKRICNLSEKQLKNDYDGSPFIAWGESYVYLSVDCGTYTNIVSALRYPVMIGE